MDQKFYEDIMTPVPTLPEGAGERRVPQGVPRDAYTYVGIVRQFGKGAFDANSTMPGVQTEVPASPPCHPAVPATTHDSTSQDRARRMG